MLFRSRLTAVTGLAAAGVFFSQAQASILSFSDLSASAVNAGSYSLDTGYVGTGAHSGTNDHNYATSVFTYSVITTVPTDKTSGLALDYTRTTTSYIETRTDYKQDRAQVAVTTTGSTIGAGKSLMITGKITSTIDTNFSFTMAASGNYASTAIPGIGDIPNGSVAFFTGPDTSSLNAPGSEATTYYAATADFSSQAQSSFQMKAGVAVKFAVLVYSSSASLTNLNINGFSGGYAYTYQDTPHLSSYDTLVGAHLLSPIPEPESWAMMLAGLLGVGFVARRRQS